MGLKPLLKKIYQRLNPNFGELLTTAIEGCDSVIDLGCGSSSPLQFVPKRQHRIGVDAFAYSIERSQAKKIHDELHCVDIFAAGGKFGPKSADAVIAMDVIEHFEKEQGWKLLDMMETMARKRVVVFTPNGFLPQDAYENNPWQVHRSGWDPAEMKARGYQAIGVNGWKPLRGSYTAPTIKPDWLGGRLSKMTQPFVRLWPEQAFQVLYVKHLR